eukprot:3229480-Amphidinium_carterae.1
MAKDMVLPCSMPQKPGSPTSIQISYQLTAGFCLLAATVKPAASKYITSGLHVTSLAANAASAEVAAVAADAHRRLAARCKALPSFSLWPLSPLCTLV